MGTAIDVDLAPGESLLIVDDAQRLERITAVWNSDELRVAARMSAVRLLDQLLTPGPRDDGPRGTFWLLLRMT